MFRSDITTINATFTSSSGILLLPDIAHEFLTSLQLRKQQKNLGALSLCSKSHYLSVTPYLYRSFFLTEKAIIGLFDPVSRLSSKALEEKMHGLPGLGQPPDSVIASTYCTGGKVPRILWLLQHVEQVNIPVFHLARNSTSHQIVRRMLKLVNGTVHMDCVLLPNVTKICMTHLNDPTESLDTLDTSFMAYRDLVEMIGLASRPRSICANFKHGTPYCFMSWISASLDLLERDGEMAPRIRGRIESLVVHDAA
ncbi:hypothetical protein I302_101755 [Kwoniella bestiolae CBS 10118]|uniref:Uncharacterized protein n=1 Tax=Kwoniella bestiolae CBS 10118 TaxID=1296100 RepID=A0A1B9GD46_9TREE|nr:hypothetical protein I302_00432 [Kwoniella bestiolae CBS 10118]OCF28942.1 hypothetical protein I302_00432 [Kwoniella bestiolae CBS 10118]